MQLFEDGYQVPLSSTRMMSNSPGVEYSGGRSSASRNLAAAYSAAATSPYGSSPYNNGSRLPPSVQVGQRSAYIGSLWKVMCDPPSVKVRGLPV